MAPLVGFTGSRTLPASWSSQVSAVVTSVQVSGRKMAVGCAAGADALVRDAAPGALVFSVSGGVFGSGRSAFARRSAALVQVVAGSGAGAGFVGFVAGPCPAGLVPSSSSSACFQGFGSGSWASLALAAGLGLPVIIFWCSSAPVSLPSSWGSWVPAAQAGPFASGWRLAPTSGPVQQALF